MKQMLRNCTATVCVAVAMMCATAARAQQVVMQTLIPDSTAQRVIAVYNRAATTRFTGDTRLPAGSTLSGDAALLNGTLEIGGHVAGDVIVINGDVHLLSTAAIDGAVTALGGSIRIEPGATVTHDATAYREMLRVRDDGDQIAYVPPPAEPGLSAGRDFRFGRTDLFLAVHGSYNRVEGLPIAFGPRVTLGSSSPTRLQALAIYRTSTALETSPNDLGYLLNADHFMNDRIRLEVSLYREIANIEEWDVRPREASLAAFLLHRDYRDHYDRRGWSIGAHLQPQGARYDAGLAYRNENDVSVAPRDPVTLFHDEDAWRREPLVAEGRLHSVTASWSYDSRNDEVDPADGWLIRTSAEMGVGGSLRTPVEAGLSSVRADMNHFTTVHFDIRRYARFTPYARLGLRVFAAGSVDGDGLPGQRQLTLGGEGSVPGYPMAAFDCDAKRDVVAHGELFQPFHGCDRLILTQIEYQASFPFARRIAEKMMLGNWLTNSVRWAAFFDVGRAWNENEARQGRGGGRSDFSADTGVGLHLGPLGLYWAFPLSDSNHNYNFFLRLGPRL